MDIKEKLNKLENLIFLTVPESLKGLELDDNFMPKLNTANSIIIENCIKKDPQYNKEKAKKKYNKITEGCGKFSQISHDDLFDLISQIAIDNRTRSSDINKKHLTNYIYNNMTIFLQKLESGNIELVDELNSYVKSKSRRGEKSLCSKICRYLNEWIFNKADYTINDSFVRAVLPYYLIVYCNISKEQIATKKKGQYNIKDFDNMPYNELLQFCKILKDDVNKNDKLNYHQIDHILWYAFKSDPIRCEIVKALALKLIN